MVLISGSIIKYRKTGSFSNLGVEFSGTYKPTEQITINANYSFNSMDEPIIATPKQQLFISGTYIWNKFNMNISMQHINDLYTQITPKEIKNSYTLLNTRVSYTINKYLGVFVKGENLTNQNIT